jgi:D-alanyl-D-alanine carboxypeptidase
MVKIASIALAVFVAATAPAQAQIDPGTRSKIDAAAQKVLTDTGVPSASLGVLKDGKIVYTQAYGLARISPPLPATPKMAYAIGSISKQFTATAVLLLQQDGKLKLDDPVGKYFPELTRSNEVTIRNLLTMTSGYEDFAPQDYTIPAWLSPVEPSKLVHEWAGKPLDFDPGTKWQYSNTNYVLVSLIVEKVSGESLGKFLHERVFAPAGMTDLFNTYSEREKLQVKGYVSNALAPPRIEPMEGTGWYYGDGDQAMPASTLLQWDLTFIDKSVLTPASYLEQETSFKLKDGTDTGYGLGVFIGRCQGHRQLEHSGEVGGFVAENTVYPDDGLAIVVLTNETASSAASTIASAIAPLLLAPGPVGNARQSDPFAAQMQTILAGLQRGKIDRSLFTADCNFYFDKDAIADFESTLAPKGAITAVTRQRTSLRGGMDFSLYRITFSGGASVMVDTYRMSDGKIEQLLVVGKG